MIGVDDKVAGINPDQVNNYADWRLLVEQQQHERDILDRIMTEKKEAHRIYLKEYRRYKGLSKEQDDQVQKLIKLIPK